MDVTLREFAGDKRKEAVIWSNPLFLIEITRLRVPGIASKFLKLTLTCISTNARKPILRFWLGWFGNSPPRLFRGLSVQIWWAESQISHVRWCWWDVDVPYLTSFQLLTLTWKQLIGVNPVDPGWIRTVQRLMGAWLSGLGCFVHTLQSKHTYYT
jgi:hypothetical protein